MNCWDCPHAEKPTAFTSNSVGEGMIYMLNQGRGCHGPCPYCIHRNPENGCEVMNGLAECKPNWEYCNREEASR